MAAPKRSETVRRDLELCIREGRERKSRNEARWHGRKHLDVDRARRRLDLRDNVGVETSTGFPGPNSGLSVRLI